MIVRITGRTDGFCRAGMSHPATPTDYPVEMFTDEQLEELKAEPMLMVQLIDDDRANQNVADLEAKLETANGEVARLQAEAEQAQKSFDAAQTTNTEKIRQLTDDLAAVAADNKALKSDLEKAQSDLTAAQAELAKLKKKAGSTE